MAEKMEVYKCAVCGNIVEVLHGGKGQLVCCGKPMQLMSENTVDAAHEKHVPVVEKTADGFLVKVGAVAHPMTDEHYIEFIELHTGDKVYRQFLQPGDAPQASFAIDAAEASARAYCNLHGLWRG
ncbi:MAG: desulfoferrodoxin [Deltaproteobacteria bacterium]|nr:desulfoferrodoxin [Deltaproteobacteria bacterium]